MLPPRPFSASKTSSCLQSEHQAIRSSVLLIHALFRQERRAGFSSGRSGMETRLKDTCDHSRTVPYYGLF